MTSETELGGSCGAALALRGLDVSGLVTQCNCRLSNDVSTLERCLVRCGRTQCRCWNITPDYAKV